MLVSKDDPNYNFEEYRGFIIASHKDNVPYKSLHNDIVVYDKKDFPQHAFIIGLDDSKASGSRKSFPANISDAKFYIDWITKVREQRELEHISLNAAKRELPIVRIHGTQFVLDVDDFALTEKLRPENRMSVFEMRDVGEGYEFDYSPSFKNFAPPWEEPDSISVRIGQMVDIDPIGMAGKYGLSVDEIKGKTDFELMVDQKAFDDRYNKGMLPTIKIYGTLFEVDIENDMLRAKDDVQSRGIVFSEIEKFYDLDKRTYTIPYDTKRHEYAELDYATIKEIPAHVISVSFPSERLLDRVGWNKKYGFSVVHGLKLNGLNMHFAAERVPWSKTLLPDIIRKNIEIEARRQNSSNTSIDTTLKPKQKRRRL